MIKKIIPVLFILFSVFTANAQDAKAKALLNTVTAKVNRGYDDIVDEVSTTFWVLPWKIVLGTFVGHSVNRFGAR